MIEPNDTRAIVERLANKSTRFEALSVLEAAGGLGIDAAIAGLSHSDWQVRRWCAMFLDHNSNSAALERLRLTLNDPKAKVRVWAVHSISCEPCKPGGMPFDATPLILKRLREDRAIRVRRMAAAMLLQRLPNQRITRTFRKSLATETDQRLRRLLALGLRAGT